MWKGYEKGLAIGILAIFLGSLLPIMLLGRYNHPTGDDYYYGAEAHCIWVETGSLSETLKAVVDRTVYEYRVWQGTYSAMFLMCLPPNVFSEGAYQWVTAVLLVLLAGGIFYLLKPVLCGWLGGSVWSWLAIASVTAFLGIQTVPTAGESFFWYNGSMYYTGFLAVTFFFWGKIFRYLQKPRPFDLPWAGILALFLAGGNYVTLLPTMILMILLLMGLVWKKRRKQALAIGIVLGLFLAGFAFSALAPGNEIRQSGMWRIPAWKAILKSLLQGLRYLGAWIRGWWLAAAVLITPFLWHLYRERRFRFRHPLVVSGLSYGIFCSMSCPLFYTMNSTGPARAVAVCYYCFLLFTLGIYAYWLGWLFQKVAAVEGKAMPAENEAALQGGTVLKGKAAAWAAVLAVLFILLGWSGELGICTAAKSLRLLADGEAQGYQEEYEERLAILLDETVTDAVLPPFENQPEMLYVGDLGGDETDPTNQEVARFYGKASVAVR